MHVYVAMFRCRGLPTSVWVSTTQDVGDGMTANVRADMDVESKNAVIDCRVNNGRDSVAVDFDTADSTMGPLRITKHLDLNGRKVGWLVNCNMCFVFVLFVRRFNVRADWRRPSPQLLQRTKLCGQNR